MALRHIELLSFLVVLLVPLALAENCTCDGVTAKPTNGVTCTYNITGGNPVNITGCTCVTPTYQYPDVNLTTNISTCSATPVTTTTMSTVATTACDDKDGNGVCDYLEYAQYVRCYNQTLSDSMSDITWYALIFGSVWVIFWCILTIIINIAHKNSGHHRFIHLYEELGIIILMISVGILNFFFDSYSQQMACKVVAILSHFFMVLVSAAFFFEATFAESMVHGKPKKNGCVPAVLNYILPIILAAIPAGLTFYFQQDNYGTTYRHCFAVLTQDMMWGFIIPVWILICAATLQAQLACLGCDMTRKEQDQAQCFWAKKSGKNLTFVALVLLSIWLTIMHAGDEQVLYLFILAVVLCIIFGPVLFICHTSCHTNTCKKWGGSSGFKKMYSLCPEREFEKKIVYEEKIVYRDRPAHPAYQPPEEFGYPPGAGGPQPVAPVVDTHTQAQHFYSWLYDDKKKKNNANDILFNPKPY